MIMQGVVSPDKQQQVLAVISKYLGVQYSTVGVLISCIAVIIMAIVTQLLTKDTTT